MGEAFKTTEKTPQKGPPPAWAQTSLLVVQIVVLGTHFGGGLQNPRKDTPKGTPPDWAQISLLQTRKARRKQGEARKRQAKCKEKARKIHQLKPLRVWRLPDKWLAKAKNTRYKSKKQTNQPMEGTGKKQKTLGKNTKQTNKPMERK